MVLLHVLDAPAARAGTHGEVRGHWAVVAMLYVLV